ncbi:MAG: hypothetical protein HC764_24505 [Pleurocapsa sp. CRU_1_2]|nr:hypothetical protein [Pleurocapsa sp. CRU_1_2]
MAKLDSFATAKSIVLQQLICIAPINSKDFTPLISESYNEKSTPHIFNDRKHLHKWLFLVMFCNVLATQS